VLGGTHDGVTVTVMVMVAEAFAANAPRFAVTVFPVAAQLPWETAHEILVKQPARTSVTTTFVAVAVPVLVAVIV
jgi:hypothetical protein